MLCKVAGRELCVGSQRHNLYPARRGFRDEEYFMTQGSRRSIAPAAGIATLLFVRAQLRLTIVLNANALDEVELGLEEIDVLFLGFENGLEQLTRHEIAL